MHHPRPGPPSTVPTAPRTGVALPALALVVAALAGCAGTPSGASPRTPVATTTTTGAASPSASLPTSGPAADGHRRVLFVGDSLTFGAHDQLVTQLGAHGVDTSFVGYPGTGLLSHQGMWLTAEHQVVTDWHPDVVVIEACCNYEVNFEAGWRLPDGSIAAPDSPAMYDQWATNAAEAVRIARADSAAVFWVTTPDVGPLVSSAIKRRIVRFRHIADGLGVPQIDWRTPLDRHGRYAQDAVVDGVLVPIRKADTLHLTEVGDLFVTRATWRVLGPLFAHG